MSYCYDIAINVWLLTGGDDKASGMMMGEGALNDDSPLGDSLQLQQPS